MSESAIFSRNGLLLSRDVYTSAPEYTAGPFIDITDHVISGYDWTHMIESGMSSVEPDLSDYYQKNETSSKEELSAAFDNCCTGCSAYSGGQNIDITEHIVSVTGRKRLKVERPITLTKDTTSFTLGCDLEGFTGTGGDKLEVLRDHRTWSNGNNTYKLNILRPDYNTAVDHYNMRGWINFSSNGGGLSLMPLRSGEDDLQYEGSWSKGGENINTYGISGFVSLPFAFKTDYPIVAIGVKGQSAYDYNFAQEYIETIVEG